MALLSNITDPGPVLAICSANYGKGFTIFFALGADGKIRFIRQKDELFPPKIGEWEDWQEMDMPENLENLPGPEDAYFGWYPGFSAAPEGNSVRLWIQPYNGVYESDKNFASYTTLISNLTTKVTWTKWEQSDMGIVSGPCSQVGVVSPTVGGQYFFCGAKGQLVTGYRDTPADKWQQIPWFNGNLGLFAVNCRFSITVNFKSYFITYFVDSSQRTLFYVYNDTLPAKGPGTGWKASNWVDTGSAFQLASLAAAELKNGTIQLWATDLYGNLWTANHKDPSSAVGSWTECDLGNYTIRSSYQTQNRNNNRIYTTPQINACYNGFSSSAIITAITTDGVLIYATMDSSGTMSSFQTEFPTPTEIPELSKYIGQLYNRKGGGTTTNLWGEFSAGQKVTVRSGEKASQKFTMPVSTKNWMTELWDFIQDMPLNGFLFPGTHDTLTSTGKDGYGIDTIVLPLAYSVTVVSALASAAISSISTLNKLSKWTIDQSQNVSNMINQGIRYLDLRFTCWSNNATVHSLNTDDFSDYKAVHSDRTFDVNGVQVVQELVNSLDLSKNEIVFIKLKYEKLSYGFLRGVTKDYTEELVKLFHKEAILQFGKNPFIAPSVGPDSSLADAIKKGGRIVLLAPKTAGLSDVWQNDEYWRDIVTWPDSGSSEIIDSASSWWNYVQKNINTKPPAPSLKSGAFQYMSMTQTNGHNGGGAYNSVEETADAINGPMSEWLVQASPINPSRGTETGQQPPLPYLSKSGTGAPYYENYNIVAMDFYENCPLVADAILVNLMVSWRSYYR